MLLISRNVWEQGRLTWRCSEELHPIHLLILRMGNLLDSKICYVSPGRSHSKRHTPFTAHRSLFCHSVSLHSNIRPTCFPLNFCSFPPSLRLATMSSTDYYPSLAHLSIGDLEFSSRCWPSSSSASHYFPLRWSVPAWQSYPAAPSYPAPNLSYYLPSSLPELECKLA